MSIILPPGTPAASGNAIGAASRPRWSFGRLLSRAIVILIGLVVGYLIGGIIGVLAGWVEIQIC